MFIDTHCHIDSDSYDNIEKIIENVGDNIIIISGVNDKTNKEVINLCSQYNNVYGTIGIHPTEIDKIGKESLDYIEKNLSNSKIVGIGEIGLDYHYTCDKEKQKYYFIKQIELAKKYKKTIVIHSRDAADDTYNILNDSKLGKTKIVMHCFSYSVEMANRFLKFEIKFGIGGVITFKNSKKLREVVDNISLSKLLLETDSPYLTPEPYRGQKNCPNNVIYAAKKIAEIKQISEENVLKETTLNAICQFDLNI